MILLALDPSSTKTGYAVLTGPSPADVIDAGYMVPSPLRAPVLERVRQMAEDLRGLLQEHEPAEVIVEMPDGKVHRGKRASGGAGLSVYGVAAGALWQVCQDWAGTGAAVHSVDPNTWTRGRSKASRNAILAASCPAYAQAKPSDSGGDVGDAISIGLWWAVESGRFRKGS